MQSSLTKEASKCFYLLAPFLHESLVDPYDAFLLGHALAKHGAQNLESILMIFEKILILKKLYQTSQDLLNPVHCLILEQNWNYAEQVLNTMLNTIPHSARLQENPEETKKNADNSSKEKFIHEKLQRVVENWKKRINAEAEMTKRLIEVEKQKQEEEEESIRLILLMQKKDKEELIKRREEEEERNAPDCSICLEKIQFKDLLPLDLCRHLFHPACMREYLNGEIEARHFPLICPDTSCKISLSTLDIKDFLTPEMREKWENYTFKKAIDSNPDDFSYCPTPDCPYVFVWEAGKDTGNYTCPQCSKHYCLDCRCIYHTGKSCKEYQEEDRQFVDFVKGMKLKQCPQCHYWVEKNQGCDHMTCRCGKQFCYVCGGDYPNCYCKTGQRPVEQVFIPPPAPEIPLRPRHPSGNNS